VILAGANGDGAPSARNSIQDSPLVRTAMGLGARILDEQ
jgi:hypothetical protein